MTEIILHMLKKYNYAHVTAQSTLYIFYYVKDMSI